MIIHLPPDVESSLIAKVQSGLFPSLDAALTKAAYLLLDQIEQTQPAKSKPKQNVNSPSSRIDCGNHSPDTNSTSNSWHWVC